MSNNQISLSLKKKIQNYLLTNPKVRLHQITGSELESIKNLDFDVILEDLYSNNNQVYKRYKIRFN